MLCQNCGQNEANVKYTQIINGEKRQMNLCQICAKKLGIDDISFNMPSIDFSNFLGSMFDENISDFFPTLIKPETLLCDKCGSSYEDFAETGKFGCDECYNTFSNKIDKLLKNIHGVNRHVGRMSQNAHEVEQKKAKNNINEETHGKQDRLEPTENSKLQELRERLKKEIKEERYEDAAKTRDEIKKLEN